MGFCLIWFLILLSHIYMTSITFCLIMVILLAYEVNNLCQKKEVYMEMVGKVGMAYKDFYWVSL